MAACDSILRQARGAERWLPLVLLAPLLIGLELPVVAAVIDVTATDVTTRRASMVWASDEPATDATVRVFADAAGTTELTGTLSVILASQTPALDRGIMIEGLGLVEKSGGRSGTWKRGRRRASRS